MGAEFSNIELEVRAPFDLLELKVAFGEGFSTNYCGETSPGSFLLSGASASCECKEPVIDTTANELCDLVDGLPEAARKLWWSADERVFDVGLEANLGRSIGLTLFSPETMKRIGEAGVRLAVTVYSLDLEQRLNRG